MNGVWVEIQAVSLPSASHWHTQTLGSMYAGVGRPIS